MYNIDIKNTKEIYDYCLLNKILDIDGFINKCFKNGFHTEKYGLLGNSLNEGEKHLKMDGIQEKRVEIEVIREIRVEVPVEVIKEVEKIVEVPVEIIKEVIVEKVVEKIIQVSDDTQINELLLKIQQLEDRPSEIVEVVQDGEKTNDRTLMLQETLNKLRKELTDKNSKITELEGTIKNLEQTNKNQGAVYMKGSNLSQNL
jgi:predicted RNase H-like nuclease (RuvC/YqgF family)